MKPDNLVAVIGLPVAVVLLRRGRVASDGVDEVARLIGRKFVRVVVLVEVDQDLGGAHQRRHLAALYWKAGFEIGSIWRLEPATKDFLDEALT